MIDDVVDDPAGTANGGHQTPRVVAATIGVHSREAQQAGEHPGEGWWAITDAGARVFVPAGAVQGYRTLRNGQRVHLTLESAPDAGTVRVLRAAPPLS